MSNKHRKVCRVFNHIDYSLILISTITGRVSISSYTSSASIPIGIASFTIRLKICVITAGIKNYKSIIKKKERSMIK